MAGDLPPPPRATRLKRGMSRSVAEPAWWLAGLLAAACAGPDLDAPVATPRAGPAAAVQPLDPRWRARAAELFARALDDNRAIEQLADLVAAAPQRLSGSPGAAAAVRFATFRMHALGLDAVRQQPVLVPRWVRGVETAQITAPVRSVLRVTALGGSVPTPHGGLEAEVVMVRSFEQLRELGDRASGRIVFYNRPMPRILARTFQAYGEAAPQRTNGAIEAAAVGAAAVLVRSLTTAIDDHPHTGAVHYDDALPRLPAAAVATADAELLAARLETGPVRVRLELGCRSEADVESANVIGEFRGTALPDEIVLIGAHLDAWDLGQGAHDDGAGCAHVLEAMRLLRTCGIAPRRTIRAVLFMNEENGLRGARAYAEAHAGDRHVAAIESDSGGFTPHGFTTSLRGTEAASVARLLSPLDEFGCGLLLTGGGGGADIAPLGDLGVPLFGLLVDGQRYFDYHHSALDTIDKVHERELALGAAALAYAACVLADR